jgi:hypothetical protein
MRRKNFNKKYSPDLFHKKETMILLQIHLGGFSNNTHLLKILRKYSIPLLNTTKRNRWMQQTILSFAVILKIGGITTE